jgi:predicted nucleotide-binding protein
MAHTMRLGDQAIAFLPGGCSMPEGSYPVYARLDVNDDGAATGEVHFMSEPNYPRPIAIGKEFHLHVPHPDSILGDSVILTVRFIDERGGVAGHVSGSRAQIRKDAAKQPTEPKDAPMSSRDVFVIHGRDERLRKGMFDFLRSLDLNPMEWPRIVELSGEGSPYVGKSLDAALSHAQAVVVLLTPDDLAMLRPELHGTSEPDYETKLTPQARPNVLFESGMALARQPKRTIMVEIGRTRPFSDVVGRHTLRMDNSSKKRNELAARLKSAGCPVNMSGTDWQTNGDLSPDDPHAQTEISPTSEPENNWSPGLLHTQRAAEQASLPVHVEFVPWEGQFEKMCLTVTNRGPSQMFRAQCQVLGRRNDPNPQPIMTFDLNWQYGHRRLSLASGQSGNLLIASAGEDRARDMEWMKLEAARTQNAPDSRWQRGAQALPEYDVEMKVLGDRSNRPQSEQFTIRAGKTHALEMFRRYIAITSPKNDAKVGHRHVVSGFIGIPNAKVQILIHAPNDIWYLQGTAKVEGTSWSLNCWFGQENEPWGEFKVVAVANGNIADTTTATLPEAGVRSEMIQVHRAL